MTTRWFRTAIQIALFAVIAVLITGHIMAERGIDVGFQAPSIHALCPFGGAETAVSLLLYGEAVQETHPSSLWMLLAATCATVVVGALFCGWLCPLGSIQDWISSLGRRLWGRRFDNWVPRRVDRALGYLRYGVLALVIIETTRAARGMDVGMNEIRRLLDLPSGVERHTSLRDLREFGLSPRAVRDLLEQGY